MFPDCFFTSGEVVNRWPRASSNCCSFPLEALRFGVELLAHCIFAVKPAGAPNCMYQVLKDVEV
jgi:hypothetical protein